jgi:hypothetical protein
MSGNKTPEEVLSSITEGINAGDLESLMHCMNLRHVLLLNQENLLQVQIIYAIAYANSLIWMAS